MTIVQKVEEGAAQSPEVMIYFRCGEPGHKWRHCQKKVPLAVGLKFPATKQALTARLFIDDKGGASSPGLGTAAALTVESTLMDTCQCAGGYILS